MKIDRDTVLTKADLETAVFLSRGEVDRYRIMLEHDIRTAELLDPEVAEAETVQMPWKGMIDVGQGAREYVYEPRHAYLTADVPECRDDVIRSEDISEDVTDETGGVYRAPVM